MTFIKRFGRDYSRRTFLANTSKGLLAAGVFGTAWSAFARSGDLGSAYPDELNSIEEYSRGRIKAGDVRRWRCDEAQGFLFHRPMLGDDIA